MATKLTLLLDDQASPGLEKVNQRLQALSQTSNEMSADAQRQNAELQRSAQYYAQAAQQAQALRIEEEKHVSLLGAAGKAMTAYKLARLANTSGRQLLHRGGQAFEIASSPVATAGLRVGMATGSPIAGGRAALTVAGRGLVGLAGESAPGLVGAVGALPAVAAGAGIAYGGYRATGALLASTGKRLETRDGLVGKQKEDAEKLVEEWKKVSGGISQAGYSAEDFVKKTGKSLDELGLKVTSNRDRIAKEWSELWSNFASEAVGSLSIVKEEWLRQNSFYIKTGQATWRSIDRTVTESSDNLIRNMKGIGEGFDYLRASWSQVFGDPRPIEAIQEEIKLVRQLKKEDADRLDLERRTAAQRKDYEGFKSIIANRREENDTASSFDLKTDAYKRSIDEAKERDAERGRTVGGDASETRRKVIESIDQEIRANEKKAEALIAKAKWVDSEKEKISRASELEENQRHQANMAEFTKQSAKASEAEREQIKYRQLEEQERHAAAMDNIRQEQQQAIKEGKQSDGQTEKAKLIRERMLLEQQRHEMVMLHARAEADEAARAAKEAREADKKRREEIDKQYEAYEKKRKPIRDAGSQYLIDRRYADQSNDPGAGAQVERDYRRKKEDLTRLSQARTEDEERGLRYEFELRDRQAEKERAQRVDDMGSQREFEIRTLQLQSEYERQEVDTLMAKRMDILKAGRKETEDEIRQREDAQRRLEQSEEKIRKAREQSARDQLDAADTLAEREIAHQRLLNVLRDNQNERDLEAWRQKLQLQNQPQQAAQQQQQNLQQQILNAQQQQMQQMFGAPGQGLPLPPIIGPGMGGGMPFGGAPGAGGPVLPGGGGGFPMGGGGAPWGAPPGGPMFGGPGPMGGGAPMGMPPGPAGPMPGGPQAPQGGGMGGGAGPAAPLGMPAGGNMLQQFMSMIPQPQVIAKIVKNRLDALAQQFKDLQQDLETGKIDQAEYRKRAGRIRKQYRQTNSRQIKKEAQDPSIAQRRRAQQERDEAEAEQRRLRKKANKLRDMGRQGRKAGDENQFAFANEEAAKLEKEAREKQRQTKLRFRNGQLGQGGENELQNEALRAQAELTQKVVQEAQQQGKIDQQTAKYLKDQLQAFQQMLNNQAWFQQQLNGIVATFQQMMNGARQKQQGGP